MALLLAGAMADSASAAVSVSRAEVSGGQLRIEGTATASRDITVDGAIMGRSDSGGRFRIERSGFTPPADCTVDVNDGSATPRTATLSGCTVTSPPPPATTGPPAPAQLTPASGASVTSPFTLSWTAVSDPSGIAGYNWQISTSSTFSPLITADSTGPETTQQTVGSLTPGTYFWRVQAASNAFVQGAWSPARSFTVTGPGPDALGAPVFAPLPFGTQYHPMESFSFSWSAVPGAATYVVEASRNPSFTPVEFKIDNIEDTSDGLTMHSSLQGDWNLRVRAVGPDRVAGPPSNVRTFSVSYDAPVGPAPTLVSPANGAALTLPVTLDWNDVANPQDLGYEVQVCSTSTCSGDDEPLPPTTNSQMTLVSLAPGTHFWRVRHHQGDSSPTTAAVTPWSEVRSFTVGGGPPGVASLELTRSSAFSGEEIVGTIQLSAEAPPGGSAVQLKSTHPAATPVPSTVTVPAGFAIAQFRFFFGQVTAPTAATITATLGSSSDSFDVLVNPPTLKRLEIQTLTVTGGSKGSAFVELGGSAPPGGAVVSLSSNSALARPPASVTLAEGSFFGFFSIDTSAVQQDTPVTITASYKGVTQQRSMTLIAGVPPTSLTLDPTTTTGTQGTSGRVAIAEPATRDVQINLTSSNPAVAQVPPSVTIPMFSPHAGFFVSTSPASAPTTVVITATGAGVSKTATLTVNPVGTAPPPPPPSSGPLPAPTLIAPSSDARFPPGRNVTFDWSDVSGAASYQFQVGSSSTFSSLLMDRTTTPSQFSTSTISEGDRYWRVRARSSSGTAGAWSSARRFRIKR